MQPFTECLSPSLEFARLAVGRERTIFPAVFAKERVRAAALNAIFAMDGCSANAARAAGWGRFPVQEMEEGPALRRGLVRAAKGRERVPSRVVCAKERGRATASSAIFAMEDASPSAGVVMAPDSGERRARCRGAELGGEVHGRAYRRHQLVGRNRAEINPLVSASGSREDEPTRIGAELRRHAGSWLNCAAVTSRHGPNVLSLHR